MGLAYSLNNRDEASTVALNEPDLFYTGQAFYRIEYSHAEARLATLLTTVNVLGKVTSEKGEKGKGMFLTKDRIRLREQTVARRTRRAAVPPEFAFICSTQGHVQQ
jgi:hypothetical protein